MAARSIPMASGVLPICLGEATKLAQFLLDADKEYEATVCFGVETDTYDATGTVTERRGAADLTARCRRARARRLSWPHPPGAAAVLGAQAARPAALRLRARRRGSRPRAPHGRDSRAGAGVLDRPDRGRAAPALLQGDLRALAGVRPGTGSGDRRAPHGAPADALGPVSHRRGSSSRRPRDRAAHRSVRRPSGTCRPCALSATLSGASSRASASPGRRSSSRRRYRPPRRARWAGSRCCVRTAPCWLLPRYATTTAAHCVSLRVFN